MAVIMVFIILFCAMLFLLFLWMRIRIKIYINIYAEKISCNIYCLFPLGIRIKIFPRKMIKQKIHASMVSQKVKEIKQTKEDFSVVFRHFLPYFLSGITCTKFYWHTQIGSGAADETAKLYGLFSAIQYFFTAVLTEYVKMATDPEIVTVPFFTQKHFHMTFSCMLQIRVGYAIRSAFFFFKMLYRQVIMSKTGGYQNGASDTRINEDRFRESWRDD